MYTNEPRSRNTLMAQKRPKQPSKTRELNTPSAHQYCLQKERAQHASSPPVLPPKTESSTRLLFTKNTELNAPPPLQCCLQKHKSSTRLLLTKNTELNAPPPLQCCLQKRRAQRASSPPVLPPKNRAQHDPCSPKTQSSTRLLLTSTA